MTSFTCPAQAEKDVIFFLSQSGEPIEVIYYDQYTPDEINPLQLVKDEASRLVKKEINTYYPVAVFDN